MPGGYKWKIAVNMALCFWQVGVWLREIVRAAEQKQRETQRIASGAAQGSKGKGGDYNRAKLSNGKKTLAPENCRALSEGMEPEKRAHIMERKEALCQRMKQRGIEMR